MYGTSDETLAAMKTAGPVNMVMLSADKTVLYLRVGSQWFEMVTDGDCCSQTWIESIENLDALIGQQIVAVDDVSMGDAGSAAYAKFEEEHDYPSDSLKSYAMQLTTAIGITTIIYRNSSNGYYGGSAEWRSSKNAPTEDGLREITDDF